MNELLLGMGLIGWLISLAVGFIVGGLFFLSIRLQVEYVVKQSGPLWVVPAALYARMLLVAALLVVVAVSLPGEKVPAAMIAGTVGAMLARFMVSRTVKKDLPDAKQDNDSE